jgi:hypothetical protein
MDEKTIKAAALNYFAESGRISRHSVIANEFALAKASVRADLAILSEDFIGVEIKSAKDSLKRLSQQMLAYQKYFDVVILVVASKHLKSLPMNYPGVEILEIDESGKFSQVKAAELQKLPNLINLMSLLTKAETRRFYGTYIKGEDFGLGQNAGQSFEIRQGFKEAFTARYVENSQMFWQKVRRRKIKTPDLEILSRYRDIRKAALAFQQQREQEWTDWLAELNRLSPWVVEPYKSDHVSSVS